MKPTLSLRGRWRRLALGLPTVSGPDATRLVHPAPLCAAAAAARRAAALSGGRGVVRKPCRRLRGGDRPGRRPRARRCEAKRSLLDQAWFPSLDAAVAYALMRDRKPQHVVEVGSGHSTRVLAKALGGVGEILAIDPAPRADIAGLPGVQVVPSTVQAAAPELFDRLGPRRRSVHRLQPHPDAGQRRRPAVSIASCRACPPACSFTSTTSSCPSTTRRSGAGAPTTSSRACCRC